MNEHLPETRLFVYNDALEKRPRNDDFKKMGAWYLRDAFMKDLGFFAFNGMKPVAMSCAGARLYGAVYAVQPTALAFADTLAGAPNSYGIQRVNRKAYVNIGTSSMEVVSVAWVHASNMQILKTDKPFRDVYEWAKAEAK